MSDIEYMKKNNAYVQVLDENGDYQEALLVATPKGFRSTDDDPQPVKIIDSQFPAVEHYMWEDLNDVEILTVSEDGKEITLSPGHGFVAPVGVDADYLNIYYRDPSDSSFVGNIFSQHTVVSVNVDTIGLTVPIAYSLGFNPLFVTISKRVNVNMSVLGTRAAPIKFTSFPPLSQVWEIRRIIGDMILSSKGDDGLFGNLPRLIYGEYYEFENPFFRSNNLAVFDNGGYRASGYDVVYPERSGGGGSYAMAFRKTLAGQDKSGVVILLDGDTSDTLNKYTQDDLTGLVRYRIKVMGDIKG